MSEISIAVASKAPDPAAMTALRTLRRICPASCPEALERFDHWRFSGERTDEGSIREMLPHYHDIVNPNKQTWDFHGASTCRGGGSGVLVEVLVADRLDSVSENWSSILCRKGFGITEVRFSVLWRLWFAPDVPLETALERSRTVAVTTGRDSGLLANPVSQIIEFLGPYRV